MPGELLRVLLIQSWVVPGVDVRDALQAAGYAPQLHRVDFESALVAALHRGGHHLVLLEPATSGLTRATVEALMLEHAAYLPLVILVPGRDLGRDVSIALSTLRN